MPAFLLIFNKKSCIFPLKSLDALYMYFILLKFSLCIKSSKDILKYSFIVISISGSAKARASIIAPAVSGVLTDTLLSLRLIRIPSIFIVALDVSIICVYINIILVFFQLLSKYLAYATFSF